MGEFTTFRVLRRGRYWGVKRDGTSRPQSLHAKRTDAVRRARAAAHVLRPSRVVVHTPWGDVDAVLAYEYWIGPRSKAEAVPDPRFRSIGDRDDGLAEELARRRPVTARASAR